MKLLLTVMLIVTLTATLSLGNDGIQCYFCNLRSNPGCGDNFNSSAAIPIHFIGNFNLCYKEKRVGEVNYTERSASHNESFMCYGRTNSCSTFTVPGKTPSGTKVAICCCDTDLCNDGGFPELPPDNDSGSYFIAVNAGLVAIMAMVVTVAARRAV